MFASYGSNVARWLVLFALGFATATMFLVSVRANYLFGLQLGQTAEKQQLFAWANVAADIWKCVGLIVVSALWQHRRWLPMIVALLAWFVCLISGVNSAIGVYVADRTTITSAREAQRIAYQSAQSELLGVERAISALASHRTVGEIEAAIAAILARPIYSAERYRGLVAGLSANCAKPDVRTANACNDVFSLRVELATAIEARDLNVRVNALRQRIERLRDSGAAAATDPVGEFYAWISRGLVSVRDVGFGFPLFFALLIEMVSAFGPVSVAAYANASRLAREVRTNGRREPAMSGLGKPEPVTSGSGRPLPASVPLTISQSARVAEWMADRVEPASKQKGLTIQQLFDSYCTWCIRVELDLVAIVVFEEEFDRLRQLPVLAGKIEKISGRYHGVRLVNHDEDSGWPDRGVKRKRR